jgi:tripartite ATP-independent transporter DctM subunit
VLTEGQLAFGIALLMASLLLRVPVPFAFGLAGIYYFWQLNLPLTALPQRAVATADSFTLMAIPLFIFVGILMTTGPMAMRLLNFAKALVGHLTGGLGQVNVAVSMLFSGMSGSSSADAAGLGAVEIRLMKQAGYTARFAAAVTGASACIGPLIPPSIPFLIYGAMAQVSVGRLFVAGAVPGLLLGLLFMLIVRLMAKHHVGDRSEFKFSVLWRTAVDAVPELLTPAILIGGLVSGLFTPTEAAGVAVAYGLLLVAVRRELTRNDLISVVRETVKYTGIFMFIVMMASAFGWILIREQVGILIFGPGLGLDQGYWIALLMILIGVIVIGCFMETISALALIVPVLAPVSIVLGIDPVHLGVIIVFGLQVGLITPPIGMAMYIVSAIAGISIYDFVRTVLPFLIGMILLLLLVALVPEISLALPRLIFG